MIKLFISDLDGTLLGMNHTLKKEDVTAIQKLVMNNVQLAVATGRMDHEIKEILKRMGVAGHRISQNGAFIYDREDTHIHSKTFEGSLARKIMTEIEPEPLIKTVSTADKTYSAEHNEWIELISEQLLHDVIIHPKMAEEFGTTIAPSKITLHGKEHDVIEAYKRIDQRFGNDLDSFISHESCVDIMPKSINKGNAILSLLSKIGIRPEETVCIGDSFNDISMFENIPHSYAMSTAHPEVQQKAAKVVDHVHEAIKDLENQGLI
ncbi:HAD family hydrolase [Halobacillus salinarum]|uniref:HAD family hydrolase n=1 Tax=Halobacillus salinarum TaxID=2932257 RepID=A0ABY4EJH2_9BACI|nr:HAD family hydrolase [Halobacillus salinarum]UOQ43667.1 HAD family hydrolase [Halobacillus salinarum]